MGRDISEILKDYKEGKNNRRTVPDKSSKNRASIWIAKKSNPKGERSYGDGQQQRFLGFSWLHFSSKLGDGLEDAFSGAKDAWNEKLTIEGDIEGDYHGDLKAKVIGDINGSLKGNLFRNRPSAISTETWKEMFWVQLKAMLTETSKAPLWERSAEDINGDVESVLGVVSGDVFGDVHGSVMGVYKRRCSWYLCAVLSSERCTEGLWVTNNDYKSAKHITGT